jgi:hypothetical protein
VDQQFLTHVPSTKFNGNPFAGNRVVQFEYTDGRTDVARMTFAIGFCGSPLKITMGKY